MKRWIRIVLLGVLVLLVGIQLVPVDRSNPPVAFASHDMSGDLRQAGPGATAVCEQTDGRW